MYRNILLKHNKSKTRKKNCQQNSLGVIPASPPRDHIGEFESSLVEKKQNKQGGAQLLCDKKSRKYYQIAIGSLKEFADKI